jgi:hypothetical protein
MARRPKHDNNLLTPDFGLDVYSDRLSKVSVASSGVLALVRQDSRLLPSCLHPRLSKIAKCSRFQTESTLRKRGKLGCFQ